MKTGNVWIMIAAILGGLGVLCGTFAAHGLDQVVEKNFGTDPMDVAGLSVPASFRYLEVFNTGVEYHMYHVFALFSLGLLIKLQGSNPFLQMTGWFLFVGSVLFSGSLYMIVLTGQKWWGMVAPIGGTMLIIGWFLLAWGACSCASPVKTK